VWGGWGFRGNNGNTLKLGAWGTDRFTCQDVITLRRNTMGLVTNLAEVKHLRPQLVGCGLLEEMAKLLHSAHDDEASL